MRARFLRVLCIVMGVLLGATQCGALDVPSDQTLNIGTGKDVERIDLDWLNVYGTVNMYPGAYVDWGIYAYGGIVNVYGGELGTDEYGNDFYFVVFSGSVVTVYGTNFQVNGQPAGTEFTGGLLTGTYENGDPIHLLFVSDTPIYLAEPQTPPDTPTELIQDLVATVATMNLQQGIDNSLDAKLDAALNALDDVNENNDVAAINSMQAFINAVEAQRGNKLTDAQANTLVGQAQIIIDLLIQG